MARLAIALVTAALLASCGGRIAMLNEDASTSERTSSDAGATWDAGASWDGSRLRDSGPEPEDATVFDGAVAEAAADVASSMSNAHGACVIRDGYTNLPSPADPDVGKGYAKSEKDAGSYAEVLAACADADFQAIMGTYCARNPDQSMNSAQWEVAYYPDPASIAPGTTTGCAMSGCNYHNCP